MLFDFSTAEPTVVAQAVTPQPALLTATQLVATPAPVPSPRLELAAQAEPALAMACEPAAITEVPMSHPAPSYGAEMEPDRMPIFSEGPAGEVQRRIAIFVGILLVIFLLLSQIG